MTPTSTPDVLAEIWAIKDSLSAGHGHSLKATCRALYAEQQKKPGVFVNLGAAPRQIKTVDPTGGVSEFPEAPGAPRQRPGLKARRPR